MLNGEDILYRLESHLDGGTAPVPLTGLAAIHYGDGQSELVDALIAQAAKSLRMRGAKLAGAIQVNKPRTDRCRCDMDLEDLATGTLVPISQDRGKEARGCKLNMQGLEEIVGLSQAALQAGAEILIINRFGKAEADGRAFRPVIAAAAEKGIPVLLAVSDANLAAWKTFTGEDGTVIHLDTLIRNDVSSAA